MSRIKKHLKIFAIIMLLIISMGRVQVMAATIPDDTLKDNSPTSYTNTANTVVTTPTPAESTPKPSTSTPAPSASTPAPSTATPKPSAQKIPDAGTNSSIIVFIVVAVLVAIISFLKIRDYKKKMK